MCRDWMHGTIIRDRACKTTSYGTVVHTSVCRESFSAIFCNLKLLLFFLNSTSGLASLQCFDAVGWAAGRASGL